MGLRYCICPSLSGQIAAFCLNRPIYINTELFLEEIEKYAQFHNEVLTSNQNVFDLIFTIRSTHVQTSTEDSLPAYDNLPGSYSSALPLLNKNSDVTQGQVSALTGIVHLLKSVTPIVTHFFNTRGARGRQPVIL